MAKTYHVRDYVEQNLYLSVALFTNSVRCFFIPGWQAQFCSNHFNSRTRIKAFNQIEKFPTLNSPRKEMSRTALPSQLLTE